MSNNIKRKLSTLSLAIKLTVHQPKTEAQIFDDAVYLFINRIIEGGYNE